MSGNPPEVGVDPPEVGFVCALDALDAYLAVVADAEGLEDISYDVRPGSKAGDNYVGVVHKVALRGRRRGADAAEEDASLALIFKCQPDSGKRREQFSSAIYFANEAVVYNEVLATFERFQTEKRLPPGATFASFPKCHHADADALLLEDMTPRGFVMLDRQQPLDVAHCSLILHELARFHALSFALRDQRPVEFDRLKRAVKETLYIPVEEQTLLKCWTDSAANAEEKFVELSRVGGEARYAGALRAFVDGYYPAMVDAVQGEAAEPYAVITHGDCWTNNLLFKYGEKAGVPEALCFLDFQIARYSSVVCDLAYLLFTCTEQTLRGEHYDALVHGYHDTLSRFLRELGSDPDELFPFAALQIQLAEFGKFGLGMALLVVQYFTCSPEDVPDLGACSDGDAALDTLLRGGAECWRRLNGIIEDSVDRGYIG